MLGTVWPCGHLPVPTAGGRTTFMASVYPLPNYHMKHMQQLPCRNSAGGQSDRVVLADRAAKASRAKPLSFL